MWMVMMKHKAVFKVLMLVRMVRKIKRRSFARWGRGSMQPMIGLWGDSGI